VVEHAQANRQLIERFYAAFNNRDGDAMAACYAPNARFHDPVFQELRGAEPGAMWRMLTGRADDLRIELVDHDADETTGTAHWLADSTFTQTGRPVHNDVQARFGFADGLIAEHDDSFGFHAWARQALGPPGLLLGWTPIIQRPVRRRARAGLNEFMLQDKAIQDFAEGEAYGDDPLKARRVEEKPPGDAPGA
jgi:ketosteroid isomerase-like protein